MKHTVSLVNVLDRALSLRPPRAAWLAALLVAATAPGAAAQAFDVSIFKIEVNQCIQAGATPLVAGRATFVRTYLRMKNPPTQPLPIDGVLHVMVNGVEAPFSPVFSDNGPFPATVTVDPTIADGTLNFVFLAPDSANVVLTVDVNPPGPNFVAEPNTSNNSLSTPTLVFGEQKVNEIAYEPIDYRPTGGSIPNLPDPNQIAPGSGDNFVQGIYPVSDWFYHRSDAPSKLWTSSLEPDGSGLLSSLQADAALMSPVPNFIYGWVPGALSYNGVSFINSNVAMGNTELIRFQRTIAHEMGHDFGLQHNTLTTGVIGIDVERELHITQDLGLIKDASLKDIMYAGLFTNQAWIAPVNYNFFYNSPHFNFPLKSDSPTVPGPLFVAGTWNKSSGAIALNDLFALPTGRLTLPDLDGSADLVVRLYAGGALLSELPIMARGTGDSCADSDSPVAGTHAGFLAIVDTHGAQPDRLVIEPVPGHHATALDLRASANAPVVSFVSPASGEVTGPLHVQWQGSDADGDALTYYLRYTPDGGQRWVPILTSTQLTSMDVNLAQLPRLVPGHGYFELLASDGLHTVRTQTAPLAPSGSYSDSLTGNPPWINLTTPDSGLSFLKGGTVVLHAAAWDLEDNGLSGTSLVWTSDKDGLLGTGRLLSVKSLSVGQHVITVTGTDSDGMTTSSSSTIMVLDRGLPTEGQVCQADLGSGGPGSSQLGVCGGDLSTGTTADLQLTGAPANQPAFLFAGLANGSVPLKGGTLVPFPWTLIVNLTTDGAGQVLLPGLAGGGGPLSVYAQFAINDPAQTLGFGFSNAVRIDFLP